MSRTHKIDRARRAHAASRARVVAFNRSRPNRGLEPQERAEAIATLDRLTRDREKGKSEEDARRSGVRHGNKRKSRAQSDRIKRRAERRRHTDPALDAEGNLGLEARPASPARLRDWRWS